MLKSFKKVLRSVPVKGNANYVKKLLASNAAFMAVILPTVSANTSLDVPQTSLMIPQAQLDNSFQITEAKVENAQIPLTYVYMSQGFSSYHPAIDLASDAKTPVKPILSGTVIEAGFSTVGYGNNVIVKHSDGLESLYAHLSKINVKPGDKVTEDTILGIVGSTGHSTGIHLHLEIHQNGKTLNPLSFLPAIYKKGLLTTK